MDLELETGSSSEARPITTGEERDGRDDATPRKGVRGKDIGWEEGRVCAPNPRKGLRSS